MKAILATFALLASVTLAHAFEPETVFKAACESVELERHAKLEAACKANAMPRVVKSGERFDARYSAGKQLNQFAATVSN